VRTTGGLSYSLRFRWVFGQVVLISGFFVHQVLAVTGTVSANSFNTDAVSKAHDAIVDALEVRHVIRKCASVMSVCMYVCRFTMHDRSWCCPQNLVQNRDQNPPAREQGAVMRLRLRHLLRDVLGTQPKVTAFLSEHWHTFTTLPGAETFFARGDDTRCESYASRLCGQHVGVSGRLWYSRQPRALLWGAAARCARWNRSSQQTSARRRKCTNASIFFSGVL
jgi:hypothetical protein